MLDGSVVGCLTGLVGGAREWLAQASLHAPAGEGVWLAS